jgi:transposase InsO family protein
MYIQRCSRCAVKLRKGKDQRHTLVSTQEGYPWRKLSIDFVGPLRTSSRGNNYILTAKDCFSRWIEAFPTNQIDAPEVARLLHGNVFNRYGMPEQVHADNGSQFSSQLMAEVYAELGMVPTHTPDYNPKSNPVERTHRDLGNILRALGDGDHVDWEADLDAALLALRTARNRHTGVTPHFCLFGREAVLPVDIAMGNVPKAKRGPQEYANQLRDHLEKAYRHIRVDLQQAVERARGGYTNKLRGEPLEVDQLVWLYTPKVRPGNSKKLTSFWTGPWRVTQKRSDVLFALETVGTWSRKEMKLTVSIDRLKRYQGEVNDDQPEVDLNPAEVEDEDEFVENLGGSDQTLPTPPPVTVSRPVPFDIITDLPPKKEGDDKPMEKEENEDEKQKNEGDDNQMEEEDKGEKTEEEEQKTDEGVEKQKEKEERNEITMEDIEAEPDHNAQSPSEAVDHADSTMDMESKGPGNESSASGSDGHSPHAVQSEKRKDELEHVARTPPQRRSTRLRHRLMFDAVSKVKRRKDIASLWANLIEAMRPRSP